MKPISLENKKINMDKLKKYGFVYQNGLWCYTTSVLDGEFRLKVLIKDNLITTELTEVSTDEPYTLHLVQSANGKFVGKIRQEYEDILEDIANSCFEFEVFEFKQALEIIEYVKSKYGSEIEYLWEKFPRNAVCRRADNKKWYLAILSVRADKLGFDSDEIIEVIDIRADKESVPQLLRADNIYPAYHMNKKSWITIVLDGSMNISQIFKMIDESYNLASRK